MIRLLGLLLVFCATTAKAAPLRVMNFNIMCDFCKSDESKGSLSDRLPSIADTIRRHDPDLISLQELRNGHQVRRLVQRLQTRYLAFFSGNAVVNYADTTLLVKKQRFEVLRRWGQWIGPKAGFNFGWKFGFPRRFEAVELRDLKSRRTFVFAGAHFDNAGLNREASAKLLREWLPPGGVPAIFSADTNILPLHQEYPSLILNFRNSFESVAQPLFLTSSNELKPAVAPYPSEACFAGMEERFPDCRIDHVLLSENARWKVTRWVLDLMRYPGGFASDHRAVVVDLE